jgi:very-short-patch-repair endonuclease
MHETEALALAARQHGLAHRKQLTKLGWTRNGLRHAVDSGRWNWRTDRVLELVGSAATPEQRVLAAILDLNVDAAVSHTSAAARWGIPGFQLAPLHVTGERERGRRPAHVGIVHRPKLLLPDHVVVLDGIRTTTPTRTLFDLAGILHWKRTERALETALSMRLTTTPRLHAMFRQLARRGRAGIAVMRSLLDERPIGYVPAGSRLELRVEDLARQAHITDLVRQIDVGNGSDPIGRVDFVDRERRIIIEVQSDRFHGSMVDSRRDAERIDALRAAGWIVVEIHEYDIWYDPEKVVRLLREAFWVAKSVR